MAIQNHSFPETVIASVERALSEHKAFKSQQVSFNRDTSEPWLSSDLSALFKSPIITQCYLIALPIEDESAPWAFDVQLFIRFIDGGISHACLGTMILSNDGEVVEKNVIDILSSRQPIPMYYTPESLIH